MNVLTEAGKNIRWVLPEHLILKQASALQKITRVMLLEKTVQWRRRVTLGEIVGLDWLLTGICSGRKQELEEREPKVQILLGLFLTA